MNDSRVEEVDIKARLDDLIDEASMESFPASDPPAFWGGVALSETVEPGASERKEEDPPTRGR